jgi:hypothetical protein
VECIPGGLQQPDAFERCKDLGRFVFQAVDGLAGSVGKADGVLELLSQGRPRAEAFWAQFFDNLEILPVLDDPLMPAIVRAVDYWGADWKPAAIVHDRQNTLPKERLAQLISRWRASHAVMIGGGPG